MSLDITENELLFIEFNFVINIFAYQRCYYLCTSYLWLSKECQLFSLQKVFDIYKHCVLLVGLHRNLESNILRSFHYCTTNQYLIILYHLTFFDHLIFVYCINSNKDYTVRPTCLDIGVIWLNFELLKSIEMGNKFSSIEDVPIPWPVLRIDVVFCVMNGIFNIDIPILSTEKYSDCFI